MWLWPPRGTREPPGSSSWSRRCLEMLAGGRKQRRISREGPRLGKLKRQLSLWWLEARSLEEAERGRGMRRPTPVGCSVAATSAVPMALSHGLPKLNYAGTGAGPSGPSAIQ